VTRARLRRFRRRLENELGATRLRLVEHRQEISAERSTESAEDANLDAERELASITLTRDSELLREIEAALTRLKDGSYGTCANCGQEIGRMRLDAVPWSAFCIQCQEKVDARSRPQGEEGAAAA
jgi:DnaK suppressor protein